jgi:hypothetical protein
MEVTMKDLVDIWQNEYEDMIDGAHSAEDRFNAELHKADMMRDDTPYTNYIASIKGSVLNAHDQYLKTLEEKNDE